MLPALRELGGLATLKIISMSNGHLSPTDSAFYEGKTVLITGANSGIGLELSKCLSTVNGIKLVLVGRNAAAFVPLQKELDLRKVPYLIEIADLSNRGAAVLLKERLGKNWQPSIVINNAGVGLYGECWQQDNEALLEMMHTNMCAVVLLSKLFVPQMIEQGSGGILNIASIASFVPCPGLGVYGATKAFVKAFTESLREEVRPYGIRAVCFHPAGTRTQWLARATHGAVSEHRIPPHEPSEVALLALRALADNQSNRIAGFSNWLMVRVLSLLPRDWVARRVFKRTSALAGEMRAKSNSGAHHADATKQMSV
ncbi:MAG: SDR family NAD(P)-dependent oxidoreductase [Deltaproteobacteria bacterium]|nr:SDR family NAD(P)-dependent oxidoreductase [Deltaproteobacteria bacterium]